MIMVCQEQELTEGKLSLKTRQEHSVSLVAWSKLSRLALKKSQIVPLLPLAAALSCLSALIQAARQSLRHPFAEVCLYVLRCLWPEASSIKDTLNAEKRLSKASLVIQVCAAARQALLCLFWAAVLSMSLKMSKKNR